LDKEPGVSSTRILAAILFSLLLGLSPLAADPMIRRGIDVFTTHADGKTHYDFAQNPIPAGFFCNRSKAFTGRVTFKGLPLATGAPGQLSGVDTIIERLDDAIFDADGNAATRIRFRALSLVSTRPVKTACGAFHIYVTLAGPQRVTRMSLRRTEEGGGSFKAPLAVDARLTFIPVKPARHKQARKLELAGSFTFPARPVAWSFADVARTKGLRSVLVDTDGDLTPETRLPGPSNFFPGRPADHAARTKFGELGDCCIYQTCHTDPSTGKEHCSWTPVPEGCSHGQYCDSAPL
jgi:hypothetical protein